MRLQLGLKSVSSVSRQERLHGSGRECVRSEVTQTLLNVIAHESAALDCSAAHVLLQLRTELGEVQPHLGLLALLLLHACLDGGHRGSVVLLQSEPEEVQLAVLLELLVLGGQLTYQGVGVAVYESAYVAACSERLCDSSVLDQVQRTFGLACQLGDVPEAHVGFPSPSDSVYCFSGGAHPDEIGLAAVGLTETGDGRHDGSVLLEHVLHDGLFSASAGLVGNA